VSLALALQLLHEFHNYYYAFHFEGKTMLSNSMKSWLLLATLVGSFSAYSEVVDEQEELNSQGLDLNAQNPLTPYALKKNGKARKRFKVPYSVLVEYYKFAGQGTIVENTIDSPLMDLDMDVMSDISKNDVEFYFDMKRKKAYPLKLINPHSVSQLFVLDPKAYIEQTDSKDFLTAKRKVYSERGFNNKSFRYERDFVHLEDWRSLNHPPVQDMGSDLTVWDSEYAPIDYSTKESVFYKESFQKKIDEISNTELTYGNKLELLANGESYSRKIVEIKKAKKSVLMAVMSFFCDKTGRELEDLLVQKVSEGVDVKLMVEKVWTKVAMKKCMNRMVKGGVDVVYANDLLKKGEESALFHNKFMVVDGERLIMGGSNIVESDNISTGYNHMNRDNDVFAQGPIATEATLNFVMLWKKYMSEKNDMNQDKLASVKDISVYEKQALANKALEHLNAQRGAEHYPTVLNDPKARNNGVCRMMLQNPDTDKHKLSKVFMEYFNHAEERMNLTTGSIYFDLPSHDEKERARETYNKKLFRSIFAATERGVKLDIIGNGIDGGYGEVSNMINRIKMKSRFDFKPVHKTIYSILTGWLDKGAAKKNQPYLEYIQKLPNARAWANFQYMHSKMMQVDRVVSMVSSYNLEEWSGDKSHEGSIICLDESLSRQLDKSFLRDFTNSVPASITSK
jgi:phosphatidylserine/phosphatidylglycerophosphate/cardiolipin synthase-like enzyme